MAPLHSEGVDVRADRLRDPQPIERQEGYQGVLYWRPQAGGHQEGADFVSVQASGVRLVAQARSADMDGWGAG